MNIEFVYLILLGINNFMDNQKMQRTGSDHPTDISRSKIKISKTERDTIITLCDVKFNDIDLWNVEYMSSLESIVNEPTSINHEDRTVKVAPMKNDTLDIYINGDVRKKNKGNENTEKDKIGFIKSKKKKNLGFLTSSAM